MAKVQKIGRVTFRELTNEEALQKYGSSLVFVGSRPASLEQAAKAVGDRAVRRLANERQIEVEDGIGATWGSAN